jgi:putative ABC transport system permease protein
MFKHIFSLTLKSMLNRKVTTALTIFSVACSIAILLTVRKMKEAARHSFEATISDVDLILGARSSDINLMLYSVFRIGNATNNITWQSYQDVAARPEVNWIIPFQLGDSHKGFRVLGTDKSYFQHFKFGKGQPLTLDSGKPFSLIQEVVLGSEVARSLDYKIGSKIFLSHGISDTSFQDHKEIEFVVVGILAPTGTPVDRTVHTSLEAIEAIHKGWEEGAPPLETTKTDLSKAFPVTQITSAMIGLKQKNLVFKLQRYVNEYEEEPLQGAMPGVAFMQLWNIVGVIETAFTAVSYLVLMSGLIGMITAVLTSLSERRREMAILRALGARPRHILLLLLSETTVLVTFSAGLSSLFLLSFMYLLSPWLAQEFGLHLALIQFTASDALVLVFVIASGMLAGLIPAISAYRNSLSDGLTIRT